MAMTRNPARLPALARIGLLATSVTAAAVGLMAIVTGHAPERSTRFGLAGALSGSDAVAFGVICLLVATVPLLPFVRRKQAAAALGVLIGACLLTATFYFAYS